MFYTISDLARIYGNRNGWRNIVKTSHHFTVVSGYNNRLLYTSTLKNKGLKHLYDTTKINNRKQGYIKRTNNKTAI